MGLTEILVGAVLLVIAISLDVLTTGVAYGAGQINVPVINRVVIDIIGSAILGIALVLGAVIGHFIPDSVGAIAGFAILASLGVYKIIYWLVTRRREPEKLNSKKTISWRETFVLAVFLAVDCAAVGIGHTIENFDIVFVLVAIALSLVADLLFFYIGLGIGKRVTRRAKFDLSWLSGVILIGISFMHLFGI